MSEEEIIKILEHWKTTISVCDFDGNNRIVRAIEGILDLYNKEKEKNKELYEDNQKQWAERCKLAIELGNNTVSKDKIREKISVLEKIQSEFTNNEELRIKIITLKDLLLEEE